MWSIQGFSMRTFKWEKHFSPSKESSTAPVWIRLEGLPLYLFEGNTICSIANAVGNPLRIDPRTLNRSILSYACICVKMDVSQPCIDSIWINILDETSKVNIDGFWVKVLYDFIPQYCQACSHIGHGRDQCKQSPADQVFDNLPDSKPLVSTVLNEKPPVQQIEKTTTRHNIKPLKTMAGSPYASERGQLNPKSSIDSDGFLSRTSRAVISKTQPIQAKELGELTNNSFITLSLPEDKEKEMQNYTPAFTQDKGNDKRIEEEQKESRANDQKVNQTKIQHLGQPNSSGFVGRVEVCSVHTEITGEANNDNQDKGKQIEIGESRKTIIPKTQQPTTKPKENGGANNITSTSKMQLTGGINNSWADSTEAGEEDMFPEEVGVGTSKGEPKKRDQIQNKVRTNQKDQNKGATVKGKSKQAAKIDTKRLICQDDSLNKHIDYVDYGSGGFRLIARRSLSPIGRASSKLKSLRNKTQTIQISTERTNLVKTKDYEEFFLADVERVRKAKNGRAEGNPAGSGQSRPRRNRGRNRNYGTPDKPQYRGKGQHSLL